MLFLLKSIANRKACIKPNTGRFYEVQDRQNIQADANGSIGESKLQSNCPINA